MDNWLPEKWDRFFRRHPKLFAAVVLLAAALAAPFALTVTKAAVVLYQAF